MLKISTGTVIIPDCTVQDRQLNLFQKLHP